MLRQKSFAKLHVPSVLNISIRLKRRFRLFFQIKVNRMQDYYRCKTTIDL